MTAKRFLVNFSEIFSDNADKHEEDNYNCNICLEIAVDPIISFCGHLYCWACIFHWMQRHPDLSQCPVCKSVMGRNTLIAIEGVFENRHLSRINLNNVPWRKPCLTFDQHRRFSMGYETDRLTYPVQVPPFSMFTSGRKLLVPKKLPRKMPLAPELQALEPNTFPSVLMYDQAPMGQRIVTLIICMYLMYMLIQSC